MYRANILITLNFLYPFVEAKIGYFLSRVDHFYWSHHDYHNQTRLLKPCVGTVFPRHRLWVLWSMLIMKANILIYSKSEGRFIMIPSWNAVFLLFWYHNMSSNPIKSCMKKLWRTARNIVDIYIRFLLAGSKSWGNANKFLLTYF